MSIPVAKLSNETAHGKLSCIFFFNDRECFLPWYKINSSEDLRKHVGEAFPESAIICRLSRDQTSSYMQDLWEE